MIRPKDEREHRLWALLDAEFDEPGSVSDDQWDAVGTMYGGSREQKS